MALAGHFLVSPVIRSKYGNKRAASLLVGRSFDSQAERDRGEELALMEKAGAIRNLEFQKTFKLEVNGILVATYRADFVYEEVGFKGIVFGPPARKAEPVVEDVKGWLTPEYKLKKKLMLAVHGIEIQEVYAKPKRGRRA